MNKKQVARPKDDNRPTPSKRTHTGAPPHASSLIKAPPAPAVMHCEEVGAPLAQDQAIREKLRLYPQATVNEIVGMFELEGVKISPAAVKKAKRK